MAKSTAEKDRERRRELMARFEEDWRILEEINVLRCRLGALGSLLALESLARKHSFAMVALEEGISTLEVDRLGPKKRFRYFIQSGQDKSITRREALKVLATKS